MHGDFDRGFFKRAEEREKTLTGKGALVGGALGALPGLALLALASVPPDRLFDAGLRRLGGVMAAGGGVAGAGAGALLGSKVVAKKEEDHE